MADKCCSGKTQLEKFQDQVNVWAVHNFGPDVPGWQPLLGIGEEAGELMHAYLKMSQGIRGGREKFVVDASDAVGDLMVFLADFCNRTGLDMNKCMSETWKKVSKRDWKKDPEKGGEPVCGNCNLPRCPACGG